MTNMTDFHFVVRLVARAVAAALFTLTGFAGFSWTSEPPRQPAERGSIVRSRLLEARTLVYNANFRNDAKALAAALAAFERHAADPDHGPLASYYAAWAAWALGAAHFQAEDRAAAKTAFETAVGHARKAVLQNTGSADFHAMLANSLIGLAISDRNLFAAVGPELIAARAKSLELGPHNPRVVMLDAGMIFHAPPDRGGSQEMGIARWLEAIALFEQEAAAPAADELQPRWGRELAYGALADFYVRATPPQIEKAKTAADRALLLRPDFWYVKEIVLPKLTDGR